MKFIGQGYSLYRGLMRPLEINLRLMLVDADSSEDISAALAEFERATAGEFKIVPVTDTRHADFDRKLSERKIDPNAYRP